MQLTPALKELRRRGLITTKALLAASDFQFLFASAVLNHLRASDIERIRVDGGRRMLHDDAPNAVDAARKQVWAAVTAVGGLRSPEGVLLWHCLGLAEPLAAGDTEPMVSALGKLERHFAEN